MFLIISALLDMLCSLFDFLLIPINLPSLPAGSVESVSEFFDIFFTLSSNLVGIFVPEICFILVGIVAVVEIGILLFRGIMWILRKIPFLGIN